MKALYVVIGIIVAVAVGYYLWSLSGEAENPPNNVYAEYFEERLIALGVEDIGQPIEGFDASLLIIAFPGLVTSDFNGVETFEGRYQLENGAIVFVRDEESPVSSAERTVSGEGYATLLENVSSRLAITLESNASIDQIISLVDTADRIEVRIDEEGSAFGVKVTPLEVLEDSRCPADVQCVWAGTVRIRALLSSGLGEAPQVFELNQPITTEVEIVTLVGVQPEPRSEEELEPGDYRFIFEIAKRPVQ